MLEPKNFFSYLIDNRIEFFTGVPDSLLKNFCAYLMENIPENNKVIAANEGNAIGIATGYHLAMNKIPLVYMQNSGLGNAINPLLSLVDKTVYNIPILLLIGWRGEPGQRDACQHIKQGRITRDILDVIGIPNSILPKDEDKVKRLIRDQVEMIVKDNVPRALIVRDNTFSKYSSEFLENENLGMRRERAIEIIIKNLSSDDYLFVSSTGKISREIYEIREKLSQCHKKDFLMIGSMGHTSQIGLGIALKKKKKQVICLEGDGSLIMHMGGLSTIGSIKSKNFKHIILNNLSHSSVGGLPTSATEIDFENIGKGLGYKKVLKAEETTGLKQKLCDLVELEGPALLEVKVKRGARDSLGRPEMGPIERKNIFMDFLRK